MSDLLGNPLIEDPLSKTDRSRANHSIRTGLVDTTRAAFIRKLPINPWYSQMAPAWRIGCDDDVSVQRNLRHRRGEIKVSAFSSGRIQSPAFLCSDVGGAWRRWEWHQIDRKTGACWVLCSTICFQKVF